MKGAANEQSCLDVLWEDLSLLNMLAQVINLFNSIFIKVQLMLDIRRGRKAKWKRLIPEVVFINNLEKIADPLRLLLVIFLKSFCYYNCGKILVTLVFFKMSNYWKVVDWSTEIPYILTEILQVLTFYTDASLISIYSHLRFKGFFSFL